MEFGVVGRQAQRRAAEEARAIISKLAALHDPDMIAGGHDRISRVADAGVNSSIGGSWGDHRNPNSRIAKIDMSVADTRLDPNAKLNISLPPCRS